MIMRTIYEDFLNSFDEKTWLAAVTTLLPEIHEVDRSAVQIWFRFYPLELFRTLEAAEDKAEVVRRFVLQGDYELKNQIDSSHKFLYGHRCWKDVKETVVERAQSFAGESADLAEEIKRIAKTVADTTGRFDDACAGRARGFKKCARQASYRRLVRQTVARKNSGWSSQRRFPGVLEFSENRR
jgi:hypothetical protein